MIEKNSCFGPPDFNYYPIGSGSHWFAKWMEVEPPSSGYKFHVSPQPKDAEIVARSVLPKLRQIRVFHKVVRDLARYQQQWQGDQKGKFITIYTTGVAQGNQVLEAIDPELTELRTLGSISPGYAPTTRESNHVEHEVCVGNSGLIFARWFDENSGGD